MAVFPTARRRRQQLRACWARCHPVSWPNPAATSVPSGLTPDQIVARGLQPGPLHILFVGNLTPLKGLHILLQAVAQLPKDDWRLTVAGSFAMAPEYVATVRHQIARDGLSRQVTLLGVVPNAVRGHPIWRRVMFSLYLLSMKRLASSI